MNDKTIKTLLACIVLLLCAIVLQAGIGFRAVQAQSTRTNTVQPVMATDKQMLYILRGNQLSVYLLDNSMMDKLVQDPISALQVMQGEGKEKLLKSYKLRKILSVDLSR